MINRTVHELYRFVRSGYFLSKTGIAQRNVASIIGDSSNEITVYFTPPVPEKKANAWLDKLCKTDDSIDFRAKILDFAEYCSIFQSRCTGRHPGSYSLIDHVLKHKEEIFGSSNVYEGVQFFESCRTLTEVDMVAPGMLVKVDEPLRQVHYRSEHRARKHRSIRKAQEFLARHNYPYCKAVRLEGIPLEDDCWEISLINAANGECLAYLRTEPGNAL
ncbi:MAG: hypothetical protein QXM31_03580 [Candidatus Woesearchaeota archaeon]